MGDLIKSEARVIALIILEIVTENIVEVLGLFRADQIFHLAFFSQPSFEIVQENSEVDFIINDRVIPEFFWLGRNALAASFEDIVNQLFVILTNSLDKEILLEHLMGDVVFCFKWDLFLFVALATLLSSKPLRLSFFYHNILVVD
jgi:hypothetical protein